MRKTKIVCTIGPASESPEMLGKLMDAGMNVCRLNMSHGSYEEHGARIQHIKELRELNNRLSEEANNLTRALKGDSKQQGNWGEMILERI